MFKLFTIICFTCLLATTAHAVNYVQGCKITNVGWETQASGGCTTGLTSIGVVSALCNGSQTYLFSIPNDAAQKMLMYKHAVGANDMTIYYNGSCSTSNSTTDCRCNYGASLHRFGN